MTYNVTYFGLFSKATAVPVVLEVHGAKWEFQAVGFEEWPALKSSGKTPFGQLPMMDTEHGLIADTAAILNYLGRQLKANGVDEKENIKSEMLIGYSSDLAAEVGKHQPTLLSKDKPKEGVAKLWDETVKSKLAVLEKFIGGKDKFTTSGTTVGELAMFVVLFLLVELREGVLKEYPHVSAFYKNLNKNEAVQRVLTGKSPMGEVQHFLLKD